MAQPIGKTPPKSPSSIDGATYCYPVEQNYYLLTSYQGQDPSTGNSGVYYPAIGTIEVAHCVGLYCEVNATHFLGYHIQCTPMPNGDESIVNTLGTKNYQKVVAWYTEHFQKIIKSKTQEGNVDFARVRNTVVMHNSVLSGGARAMAEGVLIWAGYENQDERDIWLGEKLRDQGAMIVEQPGATGPKGTPFFLSGSRDGENGWRGVDGQGQRWIEDVRHRDDDSIGSFAGVDELSPATTSDEDDANGEGNSQ